MILDPLKKERINHILAAVVCLVLTFAALVATIVNALPYLRKHHDTDLGTD